MRKRDEGISIPMKYKANTDYRTIPDTLKSNAIAMYTARPQGLSDYAVNMTNAVTNGDFTNTTGWTAAGATISAANKTLSILGNGTQVYTRALSATTISVSSNAKYYVIAKCKVTNANATNIKLLFDSPSAAQQTLQTVNTPTQNQQYTVSGLVNWTYGFAGEALRIKVEANYADAATANGKVMEVQDVMAIDISTPLGLSNEPTATEFADMLTYKGKTFWNGTEPVVINPNDKYYWPDSSGNNRHLHLVNLSYDATGGLQAVPPANYLFDGVNDYAVYNGATDIVAENGAVSAFVVFQAKDTVNATHRIASLSDTTTASVTLTATPTSISTVVTDSVSGTSTATATMTIMANQWYSVTFGYDTITKKAFISVNGGTIALGTAITNGVKKINKFVFASNANVSAFNNDKIGEFPVLNKSATQEDCKAIHNNIASRYGLAKV